MQLQWCHTRNPYHDLSELRCRAGAYAQVLDEGTAAEVRFWVDPEALLDIWPNVPLSRQRQPLVAALVERLRRARSATDSARFE